MIQRYKTISIVWGTSVQNDATTFKKYLEQLHLKKRYPLEPIIVNDPAISPELNQEVKALIKRSDFCIVMLSLDDFGCKEADFATEREKALRKRIRQNVVLELGMALNQFTSKNYWLLSNYDTGKEQAEIPSDIRGLSTNIYAASELKKKIAVLSADLLTKLHIQPNRHLLSQKKITLNYQDELFGDLSSLYAENSDNLAQKIFDDWVQTAPTFTFPSERAVFVLERIKFLTCFGRDRSLNVEPLKTLANKFSRMLPEGDDEDPALVGWALQLTSVTLAYTAHRMDAETQDSPDGYQKARDDLTELYAEYLRLKERFTISPLLRVALFDFYALAEGTLAVKFGQGDPFLALARYQDAQQALKDIADGNQTWDGYVNLDLARQAERCLRLKEDPLYAQLMKEYFKKAIKERAKWKDTETYPIFFRQALSFEYFRAKRHQLKAFYDHHLILNKEEAQAEGEAILKEIDEYAIEQMKRLKGERDSLKDYLENPDKATKFYN